MEGVTLLFVGAISGRKGVKQLMQALQRCDAKLNTPCTVVMAGSGALQEEAEETAKHLNHIKLIFPGFQDQQGIQKLFASSDVFVLPTLDDNWPLVTIEAIVSGLPQIGSIYNGASEDLAKKEEIGMFVDPHNKDKLTEVLYDHFINPPARLTNKTVDWAKDFYSPKQQAQRAVALIEKIS